MVKMRRIIWGFMLLCSVSVVEAQGVRIWNHGKFMEFKEECIDSLVFFEKTEPSGGGEQGNMMNGHEWVDLGLPSGTLWATTNVGSDTPEGYGDYFAWGEVETKKTFNSDNYGLAQGSEGFTKYVPKDRRDPYGYHHQYDDKFQLDVVDDAAQTLWGTGWRIPDYGQMKELVSCCTWEWTKHNAKYGYKVYGPNGQWIFLPAAGFRTVSRQMGAGAEGFYWTRSLYAPIPDLAYGFYFNKSVDYMSKSVRPDGQTIRPVRIEITEENM